MPTNSLKLISHQTIDASVAAYTLADVMREQAKELIAGDLEEWASVKDMIDAACNNIKHDMGERLGHPGLFFATEPKKGE